MIVIILRAKTIRAKIPSGCELIDEIRSARNKYEIEFPKPHPGQKSIPRFFNGQTVKCAPPGV